MNDQTKLLEHNTLKGMNETSQNLNPTSIPTTKPPTPNNENTTGPTQHIKPLLKTQPATNPKKPTFPTKSTQ